MAGKEITSFREFPSVEEILQAKQLKSAIAAIPRPVAADVVREAIADAKAGFKKKKSLPLTDLHRDIRTRLLRLKRTEISRVINAAGIVVHTNLGRAPLSLELFEAIKESVTGYGNVEFSLEKGARGRRGEACERYLATLAGAEAATVVNNCAAGLFITLNTLANRRKVAISRGELVQIGGGFRIPDIMKRSGARLAEVGATNICTVQDYEEAIADGAAMLLKVHKSNFVQAGFTEEVPLQKLVALGKKHRLPVMNDLGSGVFIETKDILGYHEPTVQQSVRAGADITCFSGDKMLGGVQAGLLVGRTELIDKIKKNPIYRTIRVDKIVFAALEKLLTYYLDDSYKTDIKLWAILSTSIDELRKRAKRVTGAIGSPAFVSIEKTEAYVGGGALPESAIPSVGLVFSREHKPEKLLAAFRAGDPPVVGRIEDDQFILDLKTVDPNDLDLIAERIKQVIEAAG